MVFPFFIFLPFNVNFLIMKTKNIFHISKNELSNPDEIFKKLHESGNIHIERIISTGQVTPKDLWLSQNRNEWVVLLQGNAKLEFKNSGFIEMNQGDYINIPASKKHRIIYTSSAPPCIWLAVHF